MLIMHTAGQEKQEKENHLRSSHKCFNNSNVISYLQTALNHQTGQTKSMML